MGDARGKDGWLYMKYIIGCYLGAIGVYARLKRGWGEVVRMKNGGYVECV